MGPVLAALVLGNLTLAAAFLGTFGSALGARGHHDLAYLLLVAAALVAWPLLRRRRVTTLLLASLGAWSTLTGVLLVYVTPEIGEGRWMRWWHGATSVGFLLAFLAHWARNHARLVQLARRLAGHRALLLAVLGAWALVAAAALASWATPLRAWFGEGLFLPISSLAFAGVAVALLYAGLAATSRRLAARLAEPAFRNRLRGAVDASLLAGAWLAALTGLPLLYLARELRGLDAYWLVAIWHVLASALLLALAALHAGFNRRPLAAHALR